MSTHSSELISDGGIGAEEVLMLQPTKEGTKVTVMKEDVQVRTLLIGGATVAEAVLPATEPKDARQLELFQG